MLFFKTTALITLKYFQSKCLIDVNRVFAQFIHSMTEECLKACTFLALILPFTYMYAIILNSSCINVLYTIIPSIPWWKFSREAYVRLHSIW